ncbi:protein kinase (plasmid) [Nostoc sp. UHCC 0302]|uniref:protein kinase domain-containing protein n=1 Tax=Nostoc sp. UHCC 0302 TaxID=3134896 RepID=UPI00311CD335
MSCYCINPFCDHRQNPNNTENCLSCGTSLLINNRIRIVKPLRALSDNPFNYFEVFEVDDAGTQWNPVRKQRVMKVLKWDTARLVKLIEQESLALQLIQHPNIPESTLDDFFTFVPKNSRLTLYCLVMDKFEGKNLEQWLESNGPISQSLAIEWLRQLVEILDVVHHAEFFHRDIKPSNIILKSDKQLALVDFGTARGVTDTYLAKVSGSGGTSTRLGNYEITSIVSPCYTPIEQINGKAVPQSDFYALGRTFVRLVTGTYLTDLPTDGKTGNLIWRDKASQIDKPFADFLDELMAPMPGQRPATTEVILQRLERLPLKSKLNRVIKSKSFKISAFVLSLMSIVGLIYASLPLVAKYYLNEGAKAYKDKQFDQAQTDFQKAIYFYPKVKPTVADYFLNQGKEAYKENRTGDAERDFQKAIKYEPNLTFSVANFYFEKALQHQNDPKIARVNYELTIKYNPKNDTAYNNLAIACQQLHDFNCVNNTYKIIFELKPNKWESHYGLGYFYDGQGKYNLAEEQYEIAIKSSDKAIFAVAALARLKNRKGDYNAASTLALKGLQKTNNKELQASLYKDLGWAKLMQNKLTEAQVYLEKATNLDSERTDAYCLLSQVEEALGKLNYARAYIDACILTKSSLPEVFLWRADLLDRILDK